MVPKHHRTFGRPSVYESQSAETEKTHSDPDVDFKRAKSMITRRDKITVDLETREIYVLNEYGMKIVYHEALMDL